MSKILLFSFVILNILLAVSRAQVVRDGPCKDIPPQENFDRDRYNGVWFLQARTPRKFEGSDYVKCVVLIDDIYESGYNNFIRFWVDTENRDEEVKYVYNGLGKVDKSGRCESSDGLKFVVVATDYDLYQVAYGCRDLEDSKREDYVWVYFRTQFDDFIWEEAKQHLKKYDINYKELFRIDDSKCPNDYSDAIEWEVE